VIDWIRKHKYLFLLIILSFDIILSGLTIIKPYRYSVENRIIEYGQNYQICNMENKFGKLTIIIMTIEKLFLILCILLFIFMEWNMQVSYYEIRFTMIAIYSNILFIIITLIVKFINIKIYYLYFIIYFNIKLYMFIWL